MSDSGVQEVYVYAGMRLVPETRLLLVASKLAAAEAEASVNAEYGHTAALRMNRIRQVIGDTTRDGFEYSAAEIARTVLAECDMPMEPELRRLIASEERARRLGGALREIGKHECRYAKLGDGIDCTRVGLLFPDGFTACPSCIARAALTPPPEAAKRGEG